METKSLVALFLVSCVFLSVCLQPASSQGLRWGREYEEEHPRMKAVKADYLKKKQMQRKFEDSAEKGKNSNQKLKKIKEKMCTKNDFKVILTSNASIRPI